MSQQMEPATVCVEPTKKITKSTWVGLAAFVLTSLFFYLFPSVDLWASNLFYDAQNGFYLNETPLVQITYDIFKHMPKLLLPGMFVFLLLSAKSVYCKIRRHLCLFALVTLLVGPGIIVHNVFKDSWDRARPRDVVEFGGDKVFTQAWVISDQCDRNCSFVSGHAAMGFYFMILGWLLGSRKWFYIGIAIGAAVGMIRVVQGGHFLSDSILAGFMVYWTIWVFAKWMRVPNPGDEWQCPAVEKQRQLCAEQEKLDKDKAEPA
jgi:lipid A 4'-phosphatase